MLDVSNELECFFRCYFRNRSDFNPLGEFVNSNQDIFVTTRGGTKWPHGVETHIAKGHDGGIVCRT
jgi:hypothetical protein